MIEILRSYFLMQHCLLEAWRVPYCQGSTSYWCLFGTKRFKIHQVDCWMWYPYWRCCNSFHRLKEWGWLVLIFCWKFFGPKMDSKSVWKQNRSARESTSGRPVACVRSTGGVLFDDRKAVRSTGAPVRPTGGSSCFILKKKSRIIWQILRILRDTWLWKLIDRTWTESGRHGHKERIQWKKNWRRYYFVNLLFFFSLGWDHSTVVYHVTSSIVCHTCLYVHDICFAIYICW